MSEPIEAKLSPFDFKLECIYSEFPWPYVCLTPKGKYEKYKRLYYLFEKYPKEKENQFYFWNQIQREYVKALERQNGSCESAPS